MRRVLTCERVESDDEDGRRYGTDFSDISADCLNPGFVVSRHGKRLERSTQIHVSSDEEFVRPNCGRYVVARRCVDDEVPSTVPATPVSLAQVVRELPSNPFRGHGCDDSVRSMFGKLESHDVVCAESASEKRHIQVPGGVG